MWKKYKFLISKRKSGGSKHFNDPKGFIEYSVSMVDICKTIEDYNPIKKMKNIDCFW